VCCGMVTSEKKNQREEGKGESSVLAKRKEIEKPLEPNLKQVRIKKKATSQKDDIKCRLKVVSKSPRSSIAAWEMWAGHLNHMLSFRWEKVPVKKCTLSFGRLFGFVPAHRLRTGRKFGIAANALKRKVRTTSAV